MTASRRSCESAAPEEKNLPVADLDLGVGGAHSIRCSEIAHNTTAFTSLLVSAQFKASMRSCRRQTVSKGLKSADAGPVRKCAPGLSQGSRHFSEGDGRSRD